MSTEKTKRMKMNYKVSELHHLFFNKALPENAAAGEYARYAGGTLYHNFADLKPAAAFLSDAVANDGRPAAVILPGYDDRRWDNNELLRAVPAAVHAIKFDSWPAVPSRYLASQNDCNILTSAGTPAARYLSAEQSARCFTAAIRKDCAKAAHSARDAAGEKPVNVPDYVRAINALLDLNWNDKAARENVRSEFAAALDYYQIAADGDYQLPVIQAIAQRDYIARDAVAALEKVKRYFTENKTLETARTPAEKRKAAAAAAGASGNPLDSALADLARAALPAAMLAGLPANIAGSMANERARAARLHAIVQGPQVIAAYWSGAQYGRDNDHFHLLPDRMKARIKQARDYHENKRRRSYALAAIHDGKRAIELVTAGAAEYQALRESLPTLTPAAAIERWTAALAPHQFKVLEREIEKAALVTGGHDAALVWPLEQSPQYWNEYGDSLNADINAIKKANGDKIKADKIRGEIAAALAMADTTPRAAMSFFNNAWYDAGAMANVELRAALLAEVRAAGDALNAAAENVPELVEYENGGKQPSGRGNWLLIKGREAVTNAGARVPARALRAAFDYLDQQPAGAFDCRGSGFKIGSFELCGRDSDGWVVVGCHRFSPEAVNHARCQMERAAAAAAAEAAA
jgi:hypothetical protein